MKILVTDRTDFTPKEITKLGVGQVAHIKDGAPWPRWLAELGLDTYGLHELPDPVPPAVEITPEIEPTPYADLLAALVAQKVITQTKAKAISTILADNGG